MQPMGRFNMHSKCFDFFLISFGCGGGGGVVSIFPLLPTCSLQVPNMFPKFPMCPPRVFLITPCFNPICFAQNPPLLTLMNEKDIY
jgi:hypothetical protein